MFGWESSKKKKNWERMKCCFIIIVKWFLFILCFIFLSLCILLFLSISMWSVLCTVWHQMLCEKVKCYNFKVYLVLIKRKKEREKLQVKSKLWNKFYWNVIYNRMKDSITSENWVKDRNHWTESTHFCNIWQMILIVGEVVTFYEFEQSRKTLFICQRIIQTNKKKKSESLSLIRIIQIISNNN